MKNVRNKSPKNDNWRACISGIIFGFCFFCFLGFWLEKRLANYGYATSKFLILPVNIYKYIQVYFGG